MSQTRAIRDLRADLPAFGRASPRPARRNAWILEDPDLAPAPRQEVPLTAWC